MTTLTAAEHSAIWSEIALVFEKIAVKERDGVRQQTFLDFGFFATTVCAHYGNFAKDDEIDKAFERLRSINPEWPPA